MIEQDKIIQLFNSEFKELSFRFNIIYANVIEDFKQIQIGAGVYVFYKDGYIWKVGKSYKNPYRRALEHIRDNTGENIQKGMKQLQNDPSVILLLFIIKDPKDLHWILALEAFFELKFRELNLLHIHAGRVG